MCVCVCVYEYVSVCLCLCVCMCVCLYCEISERLQSVGLGPNLGCLATEKEHRNGSLILVQVGSAYENQHKGSHNQFSLEHSSCNYLRFPDFSLYFQSNLDFERQATG